MKSYKYKLNSRVLKKMINHNNIHKILSVQTVIRTKVIRYHLHLFFSFKLTNINDKSTFEILSEGFSFPSPYLVSAQLDRA